MKVLINTNFSFDKEFGLTDWFAEKVFSDNLQGENWNYLFHFNYLSLNDLIKFQSSPTMPTKHTKRIRVYFQDTKTINRHESFDKHFQVNAIDSFSNTTLLPTPNPCCPTVTIISPVNPL